MDKFCKDILSITKNLKTILPNVNRNTDKLYKALKGAKRYHFVNKYEKFWNKIRIIERIVDKLTYFATKLITTDNHFKEKLEFGTYDDFKYSMYDARKQDLYTIVSLFIEYKSQGNKDKKNLLIKKYINIYPELMYIYFLRNKMIQHPHFDEPFYGLVIPEFSYFEINYKYYSKLLKIFKSAQEMQNENKRYFMNVMQRNWPSVNSCSKKQNKNQQAYLKLKAYNLPNPNWDAVGNDIQKFFNKVVFPFLIKTIKKGKKDNICI